VFQSSPGLVTGRYSLKRCKDFIDNKFQSSPGLVTGRYIFICYPLDYIDSFNPRPVW